jgi:hypothetical protein
VRLSSDCDHDNEPVFRIDIIKDPKVAESLAQGR